MCESKTTPKEYNLRCTLLGHSSDVRALAVFPAGELVTASRDKTAKLWRPDVDSRGFTCIQEYSGHNSYATSACCIPAEGCFDEGLTVTGSRDQTILVFKPHQATAIQKLIGHTDTVSCLIYRDGTLVSGSWDHTARVWLLTDSFSCVAVLKTHSAPLWAVAMLPSGGILTAAADKTILLWKDYQVCHKFIGHTDCVRDLAVLDDSSFLSCSNDASIRRWNVISGQCIAVYYGHSNFIYSLSVLRPPCGNVCWVSGSEDRSVRLWSAEGACVQTLHLPCQSAWAVEALPGGDVAVGCSDGSCRVFTWCPSRRALAEEQQQLTEAVAAAVRPAAAELEGVQADKLPDRSALSKPGNKDGQTVMIREAGKVMCYSWSALKSAWEAVGEVVGASGASSSTSGRVLYEGREYDYVFSVELDEGGALKLPYNNSEEPYEVAQRFIDQHSLPQDYLSQVAQFIIDNSKAAPVQSNTGYFDPFTGGNRYMPGGHSNSVGSGGVDPFTSAGAYSSFPALSSHYPQLTPLLFEAANKAGITNKFRDHNALADEQSRLTPAEVALLLEAVFSSADARTIAPASIASLERALRWSVDEVWPALDVLRLCLRVEEVQNTWLRGDRGDALLAMLTDIIRQPVNTPTQLLAIRCLCNLSAHAPGRALLVRVSDAVVASVTALTPLPSTSLEIATATLLLDCAVLLTDSPAPEVSAVCQALSGAATLLLTLTDAEAMYRVLVAVGTLLTRGGTDAAAFAKSLDLATVLRRLAGGNSKEGQCAGDLLLHLGG